MGNSSDFAFFAHIFHFTCGIQTLRTELLQQAHRQGFAHGAEKEGD